MSTPQTVGLPRVRREAVARATSGQCLAPCSPKERATFSQSGVLCSELCDLVPSGLDPPAERIHARSLVGDGCWCRPSRRRPDADDCTPQVVLAVEPGLGQRDTRRGGDGREGDRLAAPVDSTTLLTSQFGWTRFSLSSQKRQYRAGLRTCLCRGDPSAAFRVGYALASSSDTR